MTGRPELAEVAAFARLVRLGQVPTPGAVRGEMVSPAASEARRRALKQAKARRGHRHRGARVARVRTG